jgi:CubicO group peptidase (beta-lactamase class C family)
VRVDEERLAAAIARDAFTGVIAVDRGHERLYERVEGFASRAYGVANTARTRFAIASGSKAFTALAVLGLVEDAVLALPDTARRWLGDDLPLIDDAVTIEHLLTHTSGIGDYLDEEAGWEPEDYVLSVPVHTLDRTEAFLPVLDGYPQAFPPGERYAYCNGGYMVLALIAERAAGRDFHDLVEAEVCNRAGLSATRYLRTDELPGDAALGYLHATGDRTNVLHLPVRGNGDGGLYTTADDLHRFWNALLDGRIVSPDTVAEMRRPRFDTPEGLRYGMGLFLHGTGPALIIDGYDAGVSFRSTHDPTTRTTVTVIGNSSEGAWPVIHELATLFD